MKSIKPGRGPSGLSFIGSVIVVVFGIIWTILAINITAHGPFGIGFFFPLFGIIFIFFGIVQAMYHYKNATGKDRFSIFDITESHEEGDPGTQWIRQANDELSQESKNGISNDGFRFCPYCGNSLGSDYNFCPKCGKAIS